MKLLNILVSSGKFLHSHGLVIGAGGNISARQDDIVYIKKSGVDMSSAAASDYVKIALAEAQHLPGDNTELSSETPLHISAYLTRDDISGIAHTHSPYAIAAAERFSVIKSPSYEFDCVIGTSAPIIPYIKPGSSDLADAISEKIAEGHNAVILKHHGVVAVGADINEACLRALAVERAAMILTLQ